MLPDDHAPNATHLVNKRIEMRGVRVSVDSMSSKTASLTEVQSRMEASVMLHPLSMDIEV